MDPKAQTAASNVGYEDIEPFFEWQTDDDSHILTVMLPGFRRDELKIQVTSAPILKVSAQRQISGNKWRRVYKEFSVPSDCDTTNITAKFEGGILKVIFPKLITPPSKSPEREGDGDEKKDAKLEDQAKSKGDHDEVSEGTQKVEEPARGDDFTKEKGKTDNGVSEKDAVRKEDQEKAKSVDEVYGKTPAAADQKEKEPAAASDDFTKEKRKKDNGVSEKNAVHQEDQERAKRTDEVSRKSTPPAKQKEKEPAAAVAVPEAHDEEKQRSKDVSRLKTHLLDFTLSLRPSSASYQEDYKEAIAGLVERLKKMKKLMNLMLVALLVVVFVLYVKNAFKSSSPGGSQEQEL